MITISDAQARKIVVQVVVATSGPNLVEAVKPGAKVAAQGMKRRAPVDTRLLQDKIEVLEETMSGPTHGTAYAGVVGGGDERPPSIYWWFNEHGTSVMDGQPFARPTVDEDAPQVVTAVAVHIARKLASMGGVFVG
jgi:HK97 gp10 family phage protein